MAAPAEAMQPNYGAYEQPTARRRIAVGESPMAPTEANFELLDIPAFLRRQAD
jgi:hypothetical protein